MIQTPGAITESSILCCQWSFKLYLAGAWSQFRSGESPLILGQDLPRPASFMTVIRAYFTDWIGLCSV